MITISLCMIVKNEEDVLARGLQTIADLVDEIIIVDTGSTDRTKEIAWSFTNKLYDFNWIDDFAAARNFAFSFATKDYCMWLDADDILEKQDRALFRTLKETLDSAVSVVMMPYHTGFDEAGNVTFSYYRERLIKNGAGMVWKGAVHEAIDPIPPIYYAPCAISHRKIHPQDPDRNLWIYQRQLTEGKTLDPRQQYYYGRELYYHRRYEAAADIFETFLAGSDGWMEDKIDACRHCAYCYYHLNQEELALLSLLQSFSFDLPRAEVCCDIGQHFLDRAQYEQAIFWYNLALTCRRDDRRGGFYSPDCYHFIPCIQLCVCYSRLNLPNKASYYNELAARSKPNHPAVQHNRALFSRMKGHS